MGRGEVGRSDKFGEQLRDSWGGGVREPYLDKVLETSFMDKKVKDLEDR